MCLEYQLSANVERLAHGVNDWSEPLPERTLSRLPLSFLIFLLPGRIFTVSSWLAGAVRIAIAIFYISHRFPIRTVAVIGLILFESIRTSGCASKKDKGDE